MKKEIPVATCILTDLKTVTAIDLDKYHKSDRAEFNKAYRKGKLSHYQYMSIAYVLVLGYTHSLTRTGFATPALYEDLSLLLPTSGSTGSPKLVRHSYRNIEANAENVMNLFGLTSSERAMAVLPMHYTMGLSVITSHLYAGATVLLCGKSLLDPGFWKMLKDGATSFTGSTL